MQIASRLAGFTLGEADILRRAMGKKKRRGDGGAEGEVREGLRGARGRRRRRPRKIWDLMEQFAGYGFNKSHSAAYAWSPTRPRYLKAHYPADFMAALLTSERANTDKMVQYIGECREMGIQVLPPDVNESEMYFTVVEREGEATALEGETQRNEIRAHDGTAERARGADIRFGLAAIKNVGEGAVEAIARRAPRGWAVLARSSTSASAWTSGR